jgi:hypothetical protein
MLKRAVLWVASSFMCLIFLAGVWRAVAAVGWWPVIMMALICALVKIAEVTDR